MSSITSSTYPVVTLSKAGDQFAIVQGGQLKKLTRQGLADYIATLAPNTFIALTDGPGSYVGQAGKAVVVKATEDGVEFQNATSGNFLALADTPASFGGQAGKLPVVNSGETALEFIDNFFIQLGDTPSTYSGQSEKIVRVNTGATAVEFVTPTEAAPAGNLTGGFADYDHGGGTQAYTTGSGYVKVLNDATGTQTNETYLPSGVATLYDATNSQLDFSDLPDGSRVMIRFTMNVTTTSANQRIRTRLSLAIGGTTPYQIQLDDSIVKTAGVTALGETTFIYVVNDNTRNNPAQFEFSSDGDATLDVQGWVVDVAIRGAV